MSTIPRVGIFGTHSLTGQNINNLLLHPKLLTPWASKAKQRMGLPEDQRGLVILDVYKAHRTQDVLEEFNPNGFKLEFVPANCTSKLQPLDLRVNGPFKERCKGQFSEWYAGKVREAISHHSSEE